MANFTRVRDTGMWTVSVLTPTELEKFDANLFKAPNFADGGTYAPSSQIVIGGSGVNITGGLIVGTAGSTFGSAVTFNSTELHNGAATFAGMGYVVFNGSTTFNAAQTFEAQSTFNAPIVANGNVTLGNASSDVIACNGSLSTYAPFHSRHTTTIGVDGFSVCTVNAATTHAGTVALQNSVALSDVMTLANGGQILERTLYLIDASGNADPGDYEEVIVSGLTSSAETVDLLASGAVEGSQITVVNKTVATHYIGILNDSSAFYSLGPMYACKFVFRSGAWQKKYAWLTA